jgi:probable rRNA maturation factor
MSRSRKSPPRRTVPEVDIRHEGAQHPADALHAEAVSLLTQLGLGHCELSIVLCDDAFIRPLNRQWRGIDAPTDVLSFAQNEGEDVRPDDPVLGDLVISVETAARQAEALGHPLALELRVLFVHGLLHLCGYDHEESDEEALLMQEKERELLRRLGGGEGLVGRTVALPVPPS